MLKRRAAIASSVALAGAGAIGSSATGVRAQGALPKGPVRLLVGYLPGGSADTLARLIAQKFSERTGLTTLVENKPGAGGIIATEMVVKAPPDGNTLILANMASTIMAKLTYPKLQYDPQYLAECPGRGTVGAGLEHRAVRCLGKGQS
jgi:tripartite-type tricarboxylate transporter receptor subunit TctC